MKRRAPKSVNMLKKFSQLIFGADEWMPPYPIIDEPGGPVTGWIMDRRLLDD